MKIFKFGGASVSSADAIRNAASIIELFPDQKVIVISAMGNTTNELEDLVKSFLSEETVPMQFMKRLKNIMRESLLAWI